MTHFTGGCHCGAVRYEVDASLDGAIACNCSICQKRGMVLVFTPRSNFKLLSGGDNMSDYRFNTHKIAHMFCKTCGVESFAFANAPDGTEMAAININCLDGIEPREVKARPFDGRSR